MISDSQQEQATLYALGLLDADEAAAFEREIDADAELRGFVRDLHETAALLAVAGVDEEVAAPPALRDRVLAKVGADRQAGVISTGRDDRPSHLASARFAWVPWTIAALFMVFSGLLLNFEHYRDQKIAFLTEMLKKDSRYSPSYGEATPSPVPADPLAQVSFCALDPTPDFATAQPRAAVLWDAAHHQGKLRVNRLAPPAEGKDYQLWAVEKDRKDAVSAGVVHVDADGKADVAFRPVEADGEPVVAVAISLEQAGGSPTNRGPILLLGKF